MLGVLQLLAAGVVHVILSAVETHAQSAALVNSCVRTLMLCDVNDVVDPVIELRSIETLMAIAKRNFRMPELLTNIVDLLMVWSANIDLVNIMLPTLVPFIMSIIMANASERAILVMVRRTCRPVRTVLASPDSCVLRVRVLLHRCTACCTTAPRRGASTQRKHCVTPALCERLQTCAGARTIPSTSGTVTWCFQSSCC